MPYPGRKSPQWQSLDCEGNFEEALASLLEHRCHILIITAGHRLPPALQRYWRDVIDVRSHFVQLRDKRDESVSCRGRTSFSSVDLYLSYLGSGIDKAREEVLSHLSKTLCVEERALCIIKCKHGLHRSQAVARSVGEFLMWRGYEICVLHAETFHREWCRNFRAYHHAPLMPAS